MIILAALHTKCFESLILSAIFKRIVMFSVIFLIKDLILWNNLLDSINIQFHQNVYYEKCENSGYSSQYPDIGTFAKQIWLFIVCIYSRIVFIVI